MTPRAIENCLKVTQDLETLVKMALSPIEMIIGMPAGAENNINMKIQGKDTGKHHW